MEHKSCIFLPTDPRDHRGLITPTPAHRSDSTTEFHTIGPDKEVEYFFASDARLVVRGRLLEINDVVS